MMLGLRLFDNSYLNIVTITFSALIVIELLNVLTELHKRHWGMIVSVTLSLLVYFLTIFLFRSIINVSAITGWFAIKVLVITAISWLPIHLLKYLERRIWPSDYDIIMKERGHSGCCI